MTNRITTRIKKALAMVLVLAMVAGITPIQATAAIATEVTFAFYEGASDGMPVGDYLVSFAAGNFPFVYETYESAENLVFWQYVTVTAGSGFVLDGAGAPPVLLPGLPPAEVPYEDEPDEYENGYGYENGYNGYTNGEPQNGYNNSYDYTNGYENGNGYANGNGDALPNGNGNGEPTGYVNGYGETPGGTEPPITDPVAEEPENGNGYTGGDYTPEDSNNSMTLVWYLNDAPRTDKGTTLIREDMGNLDMPVRVELAFDDLVKEDMGVWTLRAYSFGEWVESEYAMFLVVGEFEPLAGIMPLAADEAALLTAIMSAGNTPTTIPLTGNITLTNTLNIPAGANITLTGDYSLTAGGSFEAIFVGGGATLTIDGITVTRTPGTIGRGIRSWGHLIMESGTISGHDHPGGGAGVLTWANSTTEPASVGIFDMHGGTISGNTVTQFSGGGVQAGGTTSVFNMSGGYITGNTSTNGLGGGVITFTTFNMSGGTISDNTAYYDGGGIRTLRSFTMQNGTISGNTATNGSGGGVAIEGGSVEIFTMENGTISGNTAGASGGDVAVLNWAIFNMNDGNINANNAANLGDGVFTDTFATTNHNGGAITDASIGINLVDVTFTLTQVGGAVGTADSTGIEIVFNQPVQNLTLFNIGIWNQRTQQDVAGATLSGSGTTWLLDITGAAELHNVDWIHIGIVGWPGYRVVGQTNQAVLVYQRVISISYQPNGGDGTMVASTLVPGNSYTISANGFTRANHVFAGWNTAADGTGTAYAAEATINNVQGNITLYAQWTLVPRTVTLGEHLTAVIVGTSTAVTSGTTVPHGTEITVTATRPGYVLTGWGDDATNTATTRNFTITADTTITANWRNVTLPLFQAAMPTASPNGGTFTTSQTVTLATATTGATIHFTTDGTTPTTASPVYTAPITLTEITTIRAIAVNAGMTNSAVMTATFTRQAAVTTFTVTFNLNGGNINGNTANVVVPNVASGANVTPPSPTRAGYTLTGWTPAGAQNNVTSDRTLTAQWTSTTPGNGSTDQGGDTGNQDTGGTWTPTTPTVTSRTVTINGVSVNVSISQGIATLNLPTNTVNQIISATQNNTALNDTVVFNLSNISGVIITSAVIPTTALRQLATAGEDGLSVEIRLPQGTVNLDSAAGVSAANQAGANLQISLNRVNHNQVPAGQRGEIRSGDVVFRIAVSSGTNTIRTFDGTITITLPFTGTFPAAVWYLDASGNLHRMESTYNRTARTVTFTTNHLSLFVVGHDDGTRAEVTPGDINEDITDPPPGGWPNVNYNPPTGAWINPFVDVVYTDWFFDSVRFAHQNNLFAGTSAETFSPGSPMTRAMMVTVLHRMAGTPTAGSAAFTDVSSGAWYANAVNWAAANGIVSGIGNGNFAPGRNITRQEMAAILNRYADHMGLTLPTIRTGTFADEAEISAWARESVNALFEAGVISGVGDNRFNPQGNGTRAEVATMLRNFMDHGTSGNSTAATSTHTAEAYIDRRAIEELERALAEHDPDNDTDNNDLD